MRPGVCATTTTFCEDSDVAAAAQGVDISDTVQRLGTDSCGFRYHLVNKDSQVIILCVRARTKPKLFFVGIF